WPNGWPGAAAAPSCVSRGTTTWGCRTPRSTWNRCVRPPAAPTEPWVGSWSALWPSSPHHRPRSGQPKHDRTSAGTPRARRPQGPSRAGGARSTVECDPWRQLPDDGGIAMAEVAEAAKETTPTPTHTPATVRSDDVLTAEGLTKAYGTRTVVDDLDVRVGQAEILGFLGPNGAGKSTSISMLSGALRPDAGSIGVNG